MTTNTCASVFNRTKDGKYIKHIIENVFWEDIKSISQNTGNEKNDNVRIFVPKDKNNFKNFVDPSEFIRNNNNWTLENGSFIVKGKVIENEVDKIKDLIDKYNNVFTITSISDFDFGSKNMQHIEIRGK